jgi:hypothetical protein
MNSTSIAMVGIILCTGPLWGGAIGYVLATRGWRIRMPFHRDDAEQGD